MKQVIRAGETLIVPVRDLAFVMKRLVHVEGDQVIGPSTKEALRLAAAAGEKARAAQIIGEKGTGKERMARAFHAASPVSAGPFQAMRCTTLPDAELDQLLFGAGPRAGGYVRAAHGGTLLLEGIELLSDIAQARLLHLVANGELVPTGGGPPERLDVRIVLSTRRELRADVEEGTLLEDLYSALCVPRLHAPPLRDRPEEIPYLLAAEAARAAPGPAVDASLVEACLLRPWPGNVRELLGEVRSAALAARTAGSPTVDLRFLDPLAGTVARESHTRARESRPASAAEQRERVIQALTQHRGNVSAAARAIGAYRTQFRRWVDRFGIDPRAFTGTR